MLTLGAGTGAVELGQALGSEFLTSSLSGKPVWLAGSSPLEEGPALGLQGVATFWRAQSTFIVPHFFHIPYTFGCSDIQTLGNIYAEQEYGTVQAFP